MLSQAMTKREGREFVVKKGEMMTSSHCSGNKIVRAIGFAVMASSCMMVVHLLASNYYGPAHRISLVSEHGQDDRKLLFDDGFPGLQFDSDQVQDVLEIGGKDASKDADLPSVVHGLWHLARPDIFSPEETQSSVVSSFAGATYNAFHRTATVVATTPRVWGWRGDQIGLDAATLTEMFAKFSPSYVLVFSEDFKSCQIQIQASLLFIPIRVPVFFFDFHMTLQDSGDTWLVERNVLWQEWDPYPMRRIVDSDGNKIQPAYDMYVAEATPTLWTIDYN